MNKKGSQMSRWENVLWTLACDTEASEHYKIETSFFFRLKIAVIAFFVVN